MKIEIAYGVTSVRSRKEKFQNSRNKIKGIKSIYKFCQY
jgi:hypothetical protein